MNPSTLIFFVLAGLLVLSSLMVVFLRNVVHSAIALVAALLIIAVLFVTLQAPMVGVLQVMVYAGAIMVLFLFVIMLLNPTSSEPGRGPLVGFGQLDGFAAGRFARRDVAQNREHGRPGGRDQHVWQPGNAGQEPV